MIQEIRDRELTVTLSGRIEQRVPANVLLKSPWLLVEHGIKSLLDARRLIIHRNEG